MQLKNMFSKFSVFALMVLLGSVSLKGQDLVARAEASPGTVMVGETAQYIVRFSGTTQLPNLMAPRVDGLDFSDSMGTSSFQQIINGRVTVETRAIWNFSPVRTGTFTIPGRTVTISGNEVKIPPVTVQAVPMDEETRSRSLLRLEIPDGPFYVGQAIPARLALLIRNDISLGDVALPDKNGEAFIHSEFGRNPSRARTRISGRVYDALVWDFIITPIKSGTADLSFSQTIEVQIPLSGNRMPSIFSMTRSRSERTTLFTDTIETEILPVPEENQPASFTGAIGDLEVTAKLSSRDLMVGEPITLTLQVAGEGNFDRVAPPEIEDWDGWRVYPPKVTFTPGDDAGFTGEKAFEFILIPQTTDITEIPGISYAVFNPRTQDFVTTTLDPEPVEVAPSDKPVSQIPFAGTAEEPDVEEDRIPESILPIRPSPGTIRSLVPPWQTLEFWAGNVLAGLLLLGIAWRQGRRRRLQTDSRLARRHHGSRKVRKALEEAQQASREGNTGKFYDAARFAIQESCSHLSKTAVEAKTLVTHDCLTILHASKLPARYQELCSELLNHADAFQFAGSAPDQDTLIRHFEMLSELIKEINRLLK